MRRFLFIVLSLAVALFGAGCNSNLTTVGNPDGGSPTGVPTVVTLTNVDTRPAAPLGGDGAPFSYDANGSSIYPASLAGEGFEITEDQLSGNQTASSR